MTKLTKMTKAGEPDLKIHPTAVEQHKKLGWEAHGQVDADAEENSEGDDGGGPKLNASEAAAKLAEENKIDLATVTGTGKDGAITKGDVQKAIDAAKAAQ